jgi:hypothetical protein
MVKSSVSDGSLLVFRVFLMLSLQHLVMNGEMNGGVLKKVRLSKSVETSCVVRSEHRAAK